MYPKATQDDIKEIQELLKKQKEINPTSEEILVLAANTNTSESSNDGVHGLHTSRGEVNSIPNSTPDNIHSVDFTMDDEKAIEHFLDPQAQYHPVAFSSPLEMLEVIYAGKESVFTTPHKWQIEELERLNITQCSNKSPFRYILSANNGSGKDSFINAPWAIFQCLCKIRSRTVITTSSYTQLVNQTESYIRSIAFAVNRFIEEHGIQLFGSATKMFIVKKEHIVCTQTGSEIIMFVTDDSGRAEGYHPFPDYPKGEVTIILNEAKTIEDVIFEALSRCTYSRWMEVSSPGKTNGKHYTHICEARDHRNEFPNVYNPLYFYSRRVTSYDCPHISDQKIESDKLEYGENSAIFRSKHLALFTSLDEQVVITLETINRAHQFPTKHLAMKIGRRGGLDLAGGGDETVLVIANDNEITSVDAFRSTDPVPILLELFKKHNLIGDEIYADDGGIGQAIINDLRRSHYNINRVLMQSPPNQKGQYGNRGAELWFRFSQFAQYIIYPKGDEKLKTQLTNRYYTQHKTQGKIILEAKSEARSKGHGSPDRADALVLCYTGVTIHDFLEVLGLVGKSEKMVNKIITQQKAMEHTAGRGRILLPQDYPKEEQEDMFKQYYGGNRGSRGLINNPARLLRECYK